MGWKGLVSLKRMGWGFLLLGALWGLAELFLWRPLGALGLLRAPIMAALAVILLGLGAQRPLRGLAMGLVAMSLKAAGGVIWPCAMWAVLSLALAWEGMALLARRLPSFWRPWVQALAAPVGMFLFILAINPSQWLSYGLLRGFLAGSVALPLLYGAQTLHGRLRPGLLASGALYLAALVAAVIWG